MKKVISTAALIVSCLSVSMASADPKPAGSKPLDAQSIANCYAGKSEVWKDCKGGLYYGSAWEAQAYCNKKGEAVGIGTWNVKKGQICHQLSWKWQEGDGVGTKDDKANCRNLVAAPDGVIWLNWDEDNQWWRLESTDSIVKGFKEKRKVTKLRKKLQV